MIERLRARRYPFAAAIDLLDMESETEVREQTTNLNVFGSQVTAQKPWTANTKVRLRILQHGAILVALGQIVNVRRNSVAFTKIEQNDQAILEKWLAEVRDGHERTTSVR